MLCNYRGPQTMDGNLWVEFSSINAMCRFLCVGCTEGFPICDNTTKLFNKKGRIK